MSINQVHRFLGNRVGRLFSVFIAAGLTYSTSAIGFNAAVIEGGKQLREQLENLARRPQGAYTQHPGPIFYGAHPGRDPIGRGGVWTSKLLSDRKHALQVWSQRAPWAASDLQASISPLGFGGLQSSPPGGGEGGGTGPGEGGGSGGGTTGTGGTGGGPTGGGSPGGDLNSNTGNRHIAYPIVSWPSRGRSGVDFVLHHNSMGAYSFDLGKGWSHSYDANIVYTAGSSAIIRFGNGLEVPYSESGGTFSAPAGYHAHLVHNTGGTWTLTNPDQSVIDFDAAGYMVDGKDHNGNTITISRNTSEKITSISDGVGRYLNFTYTGAGLIATVTDPASRVWTFSYDSSNNLTSITYPTLSGYNYSRTFTYDSGSNILTETDLRGNTWTYTYDSSERLTSFTNPLSQTSTWSYSTSAATLTDPNGKTSVDNYSSGLIVSHVDQSGFSDATTYDSNKNVTSYTDKRGKVWTATYDANGNTLTYTDPLSHTTTYTYSTTNRLLTTTDPLGHVTTNTFDTNGNLLTTTDALSRTAKTVTYNSYGETATITDALGRQTSFTYNSHGDLTQKTLPSGAASTATYDVLGRVTSQTDEAGNSTSRSYDEWGRQTSSTAPDGGTSTIAYDHENAIVSASDPLFHTGTRTIDALGRVISTTNANGETTSYSFNSVGFMTSVTNGRGYSRTLAYTDRGEVKSSTLPDGTYEQWAYDGNGNTTAYVNALGQTINYTYDNAGHQTGVDYPTGLTDTAFSYDNAGRRTSMVDASGTTSWTFDAANEVTGLTTPQGALTYTHNLAGQITQMTHTGVGTSTVSFDSAGRPSSATDVFGDVSSYTYDSAGRVSRVDNPNGTYETYTWDNRNRVSSIVTKNSSGTILSSRAYTYDLASKVTQLVSGSLTTNYGYDNKGQLTSESNSSGYSGSYTYDANGNRLTRTVGSSTETYSYDSGDKLTAITGGSDPRTFGYDAAGRTTSVTRSSGTTTLSYDFESRLTSVSRSGMTTNVFAYNGEDARVGLVDSTGTKSYLRNGTDPEANLISDGTAEYTISGQKSGSTKTTFHAGMDSNDVQTDAAQNVVATKTYDAFGNELSATGTWKSSFSFDGGDGYQQDPDTGLKLLGHRYYDSASGRFLTRDRAQSGNNWYAYVGNDPVGGIDPSGYQAINNRPRLPKLIRDEPIETPPDGSGENFTIDYGNGYTRTFKPDGRVLSDGDPQHPGNGGPDWHESPHDHAWEPDGNGNVRRGPGVKRPEPVEPEPVDGAGGAAEGAGEAGGEAAVEATAEAVAEGAAEVGGEIVVDVTATEVIEVIVLILIL